MHCGVHEGCVVAMMRVRCDDAAASKVCEAGGKGEYARMAYRPERLMKVEMEGWCICEEVSGGSDACSGCLCSHAA